MRTDTYTELRDRCLMVEGDIRDMGATASRDYLGPNRSAALPPLDLSMNLVQKYLSIVARCLDLAAVKGATPALLGLMRDSSSSIYADDLAELGYAPVPTSLLEGSGSVPGLRRVLAYLCACHVSACYLDYGEQSKRLFIEPIRPCDLTITYSDSDPTAIVRIEWARSMTVGLARSQNVSKVWDISDPANPFFAIEQNGKDITNKVPGVDQDLKGDGYLARWSYEDGRPFIPVVVVGRPQDVWQLSSIAAGVRTSIVQRHALMGVMLDTGFPGRNVARMRPSSSTTDSATGEESVDPGPGDVIVWRDTDDNRPGDHWEWTPGGDPEQMLKTIHAQERDVVSQLGIPLDLTSTGGEPLAEEIRRQQEASARWADLMRDGLFVTFRRFAALSNRLQLAQERIPETGYTFLLGHEVREAIARKTAEKAKKTEEENARRKAQEEADDSRDDPQGDGAIPAKG